MRLLNVSLKDENCLSRGLKPVKMTRLGSVVALVGRNGAGKSRVLQAIEEFCIHDLDWNHIPAQSVDFLPDQLLPLTDDFKKFKQAFKLDEELKLVQAKVKANPKDRKILIEYQEAKKRRVQELQKNGIPNDLTTQFITRAQSTIKSVVPNYIRRIRYEEIRQLQSALVESTSGNTFESLVDNIISGESNEFVALHQTALNYLKKLPNELAYDSMDTLGREEEYSQRNSFKRFSSLKKFVLSFLKKELDWERQATSKKLTQNGVESIHKGEWTINGRALNYGEFSSGEKCLFAYALLFFLIDQNPNLNLKECILIMDEPELHLHADSELDVLQGIRTVVGEKGQLWLATHSINIISHLKYEEIFLLKDGEVIPPSRNTAKDALNELLKFEERAYAISSFLNSLSEYAFVNFITQCLIDPQVFEHASPNDPQVKVFKELLQKIYSDSSVVLLDFGAGKGRLLEHLFQDGNLSTKVTYDALEPTSAFHEKLKGLGAKNVFNKYQDLPKNSYNLVVLCNVLHEIPILEWINALKSVRNSLLDDGYLMIIEDSIMPHGEKIGEAGYLIFGESELQILFGTETLSSALSTDRIKCMLVKKEKMSGLSKNNLLRALEKLEENTCKKVREIRKELVEPDYGMGRQLAFFTQLNVNAKIAQMILHENK